MFKDPSLLKQQAYVNGKWVAGAEACCFTVENPADGAELGFVPDMSARDAATAIDAANVALPGWRALSAAARADNLYRWYELMLANADDLALLVTLEQGKPLTEAMVEVRYAAAYLRWYAEEARRVYGDIIPAAQPGQRTLVLRQPIGVVAAITPWNFPLAMITRKCSPALAAGCTMVLKPAEATPLSALALAELADRAGIPAGVFNVVTAARGDVVGRELTSNPLVRKLSFTGSTATGKLLAEQCAATVKRVSLELGGQAPFLVFADADMDAAIAGALQAKGRNSGQACIAANRFLVQQSVYASFVAKLTATYQALTVGAGTTANVQQGPLINLQALQKVERHVADAVAKGAELCCGGKRAAVPELSGCFYSPTVLANVTPAMLVAQEETFGPVAAVTPFATEAEALALANNTSVGLAAYVYSRDLGRVWRVAEALEYGMVGVNTGVISN